MTCQCTRDPGCRRCGGSGMVETRASRALHPADPRYETTPCVCVSMCHECAGWDAAVDAIAARFGGGDDAA